MRLDGELFRLLREEMIAAAAAEPGTTAAEAAEAAVADVAPLFPGGSLDRLIASLLADAAGLGPLEELLADRDVDEVMVNGPDEVWVERSGKLELTGASFPSSSALRDSIDRILSASGRRADESSPIADARLPDGSRVNVALPPLSVGGPLLTIRRFGRPGMGLEQLVEIGTLDRRLARMLGEAVADGLNILVSGSTGSGKTTTLAALAHGIPAAERIVTIEDAAEIRVTHPHVVRLEARPPSATGDGAVTIRDLVRNSLRMRPDRIIVGEVRGPEAADMLDAMATGHAGSLSTIHAGSPREALERLASLVLQGAGGLPHGEVVSRIGSVIDLVVQQARLVDGSRVVSSVAIVSCSGRGTVRADEVFTLGPDGARWRIAGDPGVRARLRLG